MRARDLLRSPLRWPSHDSGWRREEETLAAGRLPPHLRSALSPLEVRPPPSPSHAASPLRSLPGGYESIPARGDQVGTRKQWQMVLGLQWQDDNDDEHHINNVNIALNSYNYNMANESIFNSGLLHPNTQDYISGCKDLWYGPYEDDEKKDWLSSFELLVDELWKNK
ncbi:hypothetical protein OsI_33280 [Oryza sativa Indica Group]|uniref:Uncharacterized protein n=1 Tax=Oryza sativa subsp. indica TaxID=39946 RepID=B8BGH7_ORYSI|nr:hypothetical protein OsI_33280 [Oryza sativa Indica Group]